MKILVIGAGAVGGYFGGRLVQAGRDVTFLVRSGTAERINKEGLQIVSRFGDATLHPRLLQARDLGAPFDVILLSVKGFGLEQALEDLAPAVGNDTMILPVLNGMRHIDLLVDRFGEDPVIGGVCRVATELDPKGRVVQLADFQKLAYGERDGIPSERMQALDRTMQGTNFDAELSSNIMQGMWDKWVQLSSLGALTCLLGGNIGEIEAIEGGPATALEMIRECAAIATAAGFPPSEAFLAPVRASFTAAGSKLASSMYRDFSNSRPVEVDQILGDLLVRGRKLNVATPLLQSAFVRLSIYQPLK